MVAAATGVPAPVAGTAAAAAAAAAVDPFAGLSDPFA
eukprot:CAMPEP_0182889130 /NCGR_PEP_ID=MMETSP0034_2-20130328/21856_1 /TAXON_ID=156128 /ORGANISM="Nephroselmis pyriformis, Strain CCMP717" /LENGTH=36 /DNA_ID= /DNA_START= /DNA_END= /DNA_ORIENTATION=